MAEVHESYIATEYIPMCGVCGVLDGEPTEEEARDKLDEHLAVEHGVDIAHLSRKV